MGDCGIVWGLQLVMVVVVVWGGRSAAAAAAALEELHSILEYTHRFSSEIDPTRD